MKELAGSAGNTFFLPDEKDGIAALEAEQAQVDEARQQAQDEAAKLKDDIHAISMAVTRAGLTLIRTANGYEVKKFEQAQAQAAQAPDVELWQLIYGAIMHSGRPKTADDFEAAAKGVAGMLERRAAQAVPADSDWRMPTAYRHRFASAVALLCGTIPPAAAVDGWLDNTSEELQHFAAEHGPAWAQGIVVLDAAALLAETPTSPAAGPVHEEAGRLTPARRHQ